MERTLVSFAGGRHYGRQLALTAVLLLFCYGLFVSGLGWRDMWYDEVGDFLIAAKPLPDIMAASRGGSLDPPLYHYFLHFWSAVVGKSEVALRFPSVLSRWEKGQSRLFLVQLCAKVGSSTEP